MPASPDSAPSSPLSIPFTEIDALLGALSPSMLTIAEDVARLRDPWEQPAWDMPEPEPDRGPQPTRAAPQRVVPRPVPELPADTDSPPGLDIDSQQAAAAQAASPGPMRRKPVRREARPQPYTEPPRPTSEGRVQKETPRSGVTRDVILRISRRVLAGESIIRVCAEPHGLALKTVRVFVEADGRLTAVGRALNAGHIMTPLDRQAGSLPPVGRQAVLHPEDHALAEKLIGATMGKMSRSLFCDLFGYDYDPVYFAYNGDGSLTEWGRKSRDAAPRGQAGAAAASTTGASAAPIVSDADCSAMEQRLFDVASDAGIAIGYWRGDTFQKLGRLMSPLAGNVDRAGGYWRIRPADAGEYRLIPDARSPEHIVNILRLHAEGHPGIDTLAATYVLRPSGIGQAVLVTPKAAGTPTTPA
uniref:hypothetical protein n=1 Tax=Bordetella sputigena TaxID=1416810 RepID=UPI0039EF317C